MPKNLNSKIRFFMVLMITILTAAMAMAQESPINIKGLLSRLEDPQLSNREKVKLIDENLKKINQHQKEFARSMRDDELVRLLEDKNILRAFNMLSEEDDNISKQSCAAARDFLITYNTFPTEEKVSVDSKTAVALETLNSICK